MREHLSDVDKRKTNGLLITSTANLELGAVPWPVFESPLQQFLIRSATPPPSHGEMDERPRRRRGPVAPDGDGTSRDADPGEARPRQRKLDNRCGLHFNLPSQITHMVWIKARRSESSDSFLKSICREAAGGAGEWRQELGTYQSQRTFFTRGRMVLRESELGLTNTAHNEVDMTKAAKTLSDLFHDTLKDIYFAEKKILTALPKMAKAAQSPELKAAFEKHLDETEGQVERLEKVFATIDKKPQGKTCDAIVGITDEGAEIMKEYKGAPSLDAGLLAAAQAVEHYEISRYGTLKAWAEKLGLDDAAELLAETLEEEKATDEALTEIAESAVNAEAEAA